MSSKDLNILIITVRADFGGGPEHIYSILKALHKDNNFYIACPDDIPYKERFSEIVGEDKIILVPHRKFRLKTLFKLKSFAKRNSINIIHSHGKGAGIYGRFLSMLTGIPCIYTFHGFHIGTYNRLQKLLYVLIERFLSHFTKKIITVSKGERQELLSHKIAKPFKFQIIENGVDMPAKSVSEQNFLNSPKKLISFTRFDYQKNSSQLVGIFNVLKNQNKADQFKMMILGSGEEETKIKKMTEESGLNQMFNFKGAVKNPRDYLNESFCYITTSRWEGLPLAVLEAMSHGVPVIATDIAGNNDIVENNHTGFLYNPENPAEAAEFIIRLSEDLELWKFFAKQSREKIISSFSLEKMAQKTQELYHTLVG